PAHGRVDGGHLGPGGAFLAVGALRADLGPVGRAPGVADRPVTAGGDVLPATPARALVDTQLGAGDLAAVTGRRGPAEGGRGLLADAVGVAVVAPVPLPGHRRLGEGSVGDHRLGRRACGAA